MSPQPNPIPQVLTPSAMESADLSSILSLINTMTSNLVNTLTDPNATPTTNGQIASMFSVYSSAASANQSPTPTTPTTLITSTFDVLPPGGTSIVSAVSPAASTTQVTTSRSVTIVGSVMTGVVTSASGTTVIGTSSAAGATSSSDASNSPLQSKASGGLSSGQQAAIAVPIVVVALAIVAFLLVCMRRRKRRIASSHDSFTNEKPQSVAAAAAAERKKKRWTRHLRMFSFDTELLMAGQYSSTNSIRSRQPGTPRSQSRARNSRAPSERSADEVAPAYRDAIGANQTHSTHPVMAGAAAGGALGVAAGNVKRNPSTATAPPPYQGSRLSTPTSPPRTSMQERYAGPSPIAVNPFSDSRPISPDVVSPVDDSPFDDPPNTTPSVSRNSSLFRNTIDDASSIGEASDAASIREAQVARHASVMSGARQPRMVDVRRSS